MVRKALEKKRSLDQKEIEKLIDKGGKAKCDEEQAKKDKHKVINIRFPRSMLAEIDEKVKSTVGLCRTTWILQALDRELKTSKN